MEAHFPWSRSVWGMRGASRPLLLASVFPALRWAGRLHLLGLSLPCGVRAKDCPALPSLPHCLPQALLSGWGRRSPLKSGGGATLLWDPG